MEKKELHQCLLVTDTTEKATSDDHKIVYSQGYNCLFTFVESGIFIFVSLLLCNLVPGVS